PPEGSESPVTSEPPVTSDPSTDPGAQPPSWPHIEVPIKVGTHEATAWVAQEVSTATGATIKIKGAGFTKTAGGEPSTVAIKLIMNGQAYTRQNSEVIQYPTTGGDATIWTLVAPSNPTNHSNVVITSDGSFDLELDLPSGITAGGNLAVQFVSGPYDAGDVQRGTTSGPIAVTEPICAPVAAASVSIENPTLAAGEKLHVTGTGWCSPEQGGSTIAVKIDNGGYNRMEPVDVPSGVELTAANIWAIIEADADGTFDVQLTLPDGTSTGALGSTPEFQSGAHSLTLLTGSLVKGDQPRSVVSEEFVVGTYRPLAPPEPLDSAKLSQSARDGVSITKSNSALKVTVPGAQAGDWIYLMPYAADGSPRQPWGWFTAKSGGVVSAPLNGVVLPAGNIKIAVLNGNQGHVGELLGWAPLTISAPKPPGNSNTPAPPNNASGSKSGGKKPSGSGLTGAQGGNSKPSDSGGSGNIGAPGRQISQAAHGDQGANGGDATNGAPAGAASPNQSGDPDQPPASPPKPPKTGKVLTEKNVGDVRGVQEGSIVALTVEPGEPGAWFFIYAYVGPEFTKVVPVGWGRTDDANTLRVDVAKLPAGTHRLAVMSANADLVGWATATTKGSGTKVKVVTGKNRSATPLAATEASSWQVWPADLWLLGGGAVLAAGLVGATVLVNRNRKV
ncbi:MAG: hypothetical protein ACK5MR_01035, partial [Cumulibacter sp.]